MIFKNNHSYLFFVLYSRRFRNIHIYITHINNKQNLIRKTTISTIQYHATSSINKSTFKITDIITTKQNVSLRIIIIINTKIHSLSNYYINNFNSIQFNSLSINMSRKGNIIIIIQSSAYASAAAAAL